MSALRMPQSLNAPAHIDTGEALLRFELLEELDAALGRCERQVRAALAALAAYDAEVARTRAPLVAAATEAVWRLIVQREAGDVCERDHLVAQFRIPPEILARIGGR